MEEKTIKFEIVIEGECTSEEQARVRKMYDFIKDYANVHGYKARKTAGVKELMECKEKNIVAVKVDVDTKEANENIKELTAAANECVEAFERLEKVMNGFGKKPVHTSLTPAECWIEISKLSKFSEAISKEARMLGRRINQ